MADETTASATVADQQVDNLAKSVEAEEKAIVETTEGDESSDNAGEEAENSGEEGELHEDKPRGKKNVQARIDELTRRAREAERQADYYRGLATQKAPNSADAAPTEPNPDDFENYGDFVKALAKYEVAQERQAGHSQQADSFRAEAWSSKVEATRATIADYDKVVGSSEIPVAGHVADALMDAERGPELAYHMANHPDLAERLNKMSPVKAAIELGRLESTLGGTTARQPSKAPAPITPSRPGPTVKTDLAKVSMDDYVKERAAQGARWARP